MRKPKPPTPRSVSATLRTAGFKAIGNGDEGYEVAWFGGGPSSGAVTVAFYAYGGDLSSASNDEKCTLEAKALGLMADALRHKGWAVDQQEGRSYLIVREAGK